MDCEYRIKCNWDVEHGDLESATTAKHLEEGEESIRLVL